MPGPDRLKGGKPRLLARHDGAEGRRYDRAYTALEADFGPFTSTFLKMEGGRAAVAWLNLRAATAALDAARRARREGRGRTPNVRWLERLAKRQGLADLTYSAAVDRLRQLANGHAPTPDELLARAHAEMKRAAKNNGA